MLQNFAKKDQFVLSNIDLASSILLLSEKRRFLQSRSDKTASKSRAYFFTHPIFESDFDCLTGKNRLQANSLLPSRLLQNKNYQVIEILIKY